MKTLYEELKQAENDSIGIKWAVISQFKENPLVISSIRRENAIYDALTIVVSPSKDHSRDRGLINKYKEYLLELIPSNFVPKSIRIANYLDSKLNNSDYRRLLPYSNSIKN